MIDYTNDIPVKKVTYPVDMLMEGLPEISMMKIDTQGSELEVLKGANKVLKAVEVSIAIALILLYEFIYSPKRKQTCKNVNFTCMNSRSRNATAQPFGNELLLKFCHTANDKICEKSKD